MWVNRWGEWIGEVSLSSAFSHHGSAAFGAVVVWQSSAWPMWGRSVSVRGSLALVLFVFGWLDRSFGWLDRSGFVDRWLSFNNNFARWPDRSSGWLDRSELSHLISLVGFDLVRWLDLVCWLDLFRTWSRSLVVVFFDCFFFCSFSLALVLCFLFFLSLSLRFASHGNELKWKWRQKFISVVKGENFGQQEIIFRKIIFSVTANRMHFPEIDFCNWFEADSNAPSTPSFIIYSLFNARIPIPHSHSFLWNFFIMCYSFANKQ